MNSLIVKITLILIAFTFSACYRSLEETNINPDSPTEASPALLLTYISKNAFNGNGIGEISNESGRDRAYAARYMVPTDERERVYFSYNWTQGSFGYYDMLRQVAEMEKAALKNGDTGYLALSKYFRAYYFYQLTNVFGDIPYSEALKAQEGIEQPKYDSQKDIFISILNELKEANDILSGNNEVIGGDIIYFGDIYKWRKLINSFRIRVLIDLSEKQNEIDIASQFQEIINNPSKYPIFESNADNGALQYYNIAGNTYYQFGISDYATGVHMSATFVEMLKGFQDPRLFKFADRTTVAKEQNLAVNDFNAYGGVDPGLTQTEISSIVGGGNVSRINVRYYEDPINEHYITVGYPELQFNLAEAYFEGWITGSSDMLQAEEHYNEGIRASMSFYGIAEADIDAYLENTGVKFNQATAKEKIISQKYISFYYHSGWEGFFNQRRTGIPEFRVGPGTANGQQIPKRWMYPISESQQNDKNVSEAIQTQYDGNDDINGIMWLLK